MSAVYSTQLAFSKSVSGGPFTAYVVPPSYVAVITCITCGVGVNVTPGSGNIYAGPGLCMIYVYAQNATALPVTDTQEGRWVLNPGDEVQVETSGGWTVDFAISGYLLTLP